MIAQFDARLGSLQINAGTKENIAPQPKEKSYMELKTKFLHKIAWKFVAIFACDLQRKICR